MNKPDSNPIIQEAMNAAKIAWWQLEFPSRKITCAPNKKILAGYNPDEVKTYDDWLALVDPADVRPMKEALQAHIKGETPYYEALYRVKSADGSYITFYDRGKVVERDDDYIRLVGFITNVSQIEDFAYSISNQPYEPIDREKVLAKSI